MGRHKKAKLGVIAAHMRTSSAWMRDTIDDLRAPTLNGATWQTDRATIDALRKNAAEILDKLLTVPHQEAHAC
jgi:signal transduction histidine kinase